MTMELKKQLKSLKHADVNPRGDWLQNNRALLLSQVRNTVNSSTSRRPKFENIWSGLSIFLPHALVYNFVRPIAVLLIVALVGTSGWIATVDAAYEALPGDWLYPAKRAAEKTQVTVAGVLGNKTAETKLHAEFAKRRAMETKKIVKSNDPDKQQKVQATVEALKKEIAAVNTKLTEAQAEGGAQMNASAAKSVTTEAEQIKSALQEVKDNLITGTTTADAALSVQVSEVKNLVKDAGVKAVEVMVEKHLEGDKTVSAAEVKQVMNNTLRSAVSDATENKQSVDGVKVVVEAVKAELSSASAVTIDNKANATTTKALAEKITAVATETKEAAAKNDAAVAAVGAKVSEAVTLLENGDLSKVVDKIKEVSEASKESEKIIDNTLKSVQTVLPVVSIIKDVPLNATSTQTKVIVTTTPTSASAAVVSTPTTTVIVPVVVPAVRDTASSTTAPAPAASAQKK